MNSKGPKSTLGSIIFSIVAMVAGIFFFITAETARNPIKTKMRAIVLVIAGLVILGCDIYSIIKKKNDNE